MNIIGLIIVQIIMFGAVIYILKRFMQGDTESAVNRLNDSYQEINKKKEELSQKIQKIEEEYQQRKEEAERIVGEFKEKAEKEMNDQRDSIIKKAREDAEKITEETRLMKEQVRQNIRKEERLKMVDYCKDILDQVFKEKMNENINNYLVEDFLSEVKDTDTSHVPQSANKIEIVTSKPLDDSIKSKIKDIVSNKLKREVTLDEKTDDKLIGGAIIKFGSLILDGSLLGKFQDRALANKYKIEREG